MIGNRKGERRGGKGGKKRKGKILPRPERFRTMQDRKAGRTSRYQEIKNTGAHTQRDTGKRDECAKTMLLGRRWVRRRRMEGDEEEEEGGKK